MLSGDADNSTPIEELKSLLLQLGFYERKGAGSPILYKKDGIEELINIQIQCTGSYKSVAGGCKGGRYGHTRTQRASYVCLVNNLFST